jgi:SAM-dependent methyltransferase
MRQIAHQAVGKTVLDIGYAQAPNPFLDGFSRTGYDLNKPVSGSVRYEEEIVGDVYDIGAVLAGRRFDTIICGELIEHLETPYDFLRDLSRLLNEDGRLILSTPNPLGFPVFLCELFQLRSFFYTREHLYYFLPRWMRRLLELSGYRLQCMRSVGLWLPFGVLALCPTILSYQVIYVACKNGQGGTA